MIPNLDIYHLANMLMESTVLVRILACFFPFVDRFNPDHCGMGKMAFLMVA